MIKNSATKRTGIYRVTGDIADFQLEIKLRHMSEWLPVPKFEYVGAEKNTHHTDYYPESTREAKWDDFFIYVPCEDQNGQIYCNYYKLLHRSSSGYPSVMSRSYTSHQSSASTAPSHDDPLQPPSNEFHALNRELCNGSVANLCIGWQQKYFSRDEVQRYEDLSKCVTALQRRYHRWTKTVREQQQRHQLELQRLRRRKSKWKTLPEDPNFAARTCLIHTLVGADHDQLPAEAQLWLDQGYQLMYVYAQLQQDILLLSLRYSPDQGLLYVYPDFNFSADDMDYVLEIDNDCRQLFAYGFQNVTPLEPRQQGDMEMDETTAEGDNKQPRALQPLLEQQSEEEHEEAEEEKGEHDKDLLPPESASAEELLHFYQEQRKRSAELRRVMQFKPPPKRTRRVSLLLQLHEAQNFEYPNIHVRYYINLPAHAILEPAHASEPFPLRGATASCLGSGAAGRVVANLSHCWQLTLLCDEAHQPDDLLHIYFEVISIDNWQRERSEGYAYFSCSLLAPLPAEAVAGIRLQCIRPVGNWLDALNRYFIGGRALFDFVGYFNSKSRGRVLHDRLERQTACAMRSTGTVLFSVQKMQQRQQDFFDELATDDSDDNGSADEAISKGLGGKGVRDRSTTSTLEDVLAAYVEARERIKSLLGREDSQ